MVALRLIELLAIHDRVIEETGGAFGIRDMGLLNAAILKPHTALFGVNMYPSVHEQAAVLLEALANYHGFVDGNKRTAFVATARFLAVQGYDLDATQQGVVQLMRHVATKKYSITDIQTWLIWHTKNKE
jgi:death on curing protein